MNLIREAEALTDAMLLAILLDPDRTMPFDPKGLAHRLLGRFGGFRGLLKAEHAAFAEEAQIDATRVAVLAALGQILNRYLDEEIAATEFIGHSRDVERVIAARYRDLDREALIVLYLNTRHLVISVEEMFRGTLNSAAVFPREIMKRALLLNAASLVAVHNHPSGNPAPSSEDRQVTRDLKQACGLFDISLLDHIIVGGNECFSFAEHRLL